MKKLLYSLMAILAVLSLCACALGEEIQGVGAEIIPADDSDMTLLVDYCKKTVATVGGNGYSEIVLYKNDSDDTYQLHTYSRYDGEECETHHAYRASKDIADAALALIDELGLANYENARGIGLCGAVYVVQFLKEDRLIRISTDNLSEDGAGMLASVGNMLYGALTQSDMKAEF